MSEVFHYFESPAGATALLLPFELSRVVGDWHKLRSIMVRKLPKEFTREEWGYLMTFLGRENLKRPFNICFGAECPYPNQGIHWIYKPRGTISIWLPNNVSLLGPLMLILLSLTGNPMQIKGGFQGKDLTGSFLAFCKENLISGPLLTFLDHSVNFGVFERSDSRSFDMATDARIRIIFGSQKTAEAINAYPHPSESICFPFIDRSSEAWIESDEIDEEIMTTLLKVFAIYGQAGCTSPRRVVLLNGDKEETSRFCDGLAALWSKIIPKSTDASVASNNFMAYQLAAALGWDAILVPFNAAVIASGSIDLAVVEEPMTLSVVSATPENALKKLPSNIQTIGYALKKPRDEKWIRLFAAASVKRAVPVGRMHHFGPVWDGFEFWRQTFEIVEVQS
jgi:hypothetical protein